MREDIVRRAVSYLEDERGDISELIRRLTEKQKELLESERTHRARETELSERRRETDLMRLRLKQKEAELREQGIRDLRGFIDSSRRELDQLIRDIREGELSKDKTRRASAFLQELRERLGEEERRHQKTVEEQREQTARDEERGGEPFEVHEGMPVVVRSSGRMGRVVRRGKGDRWVVQAGNLKIALTRSEFYPDTSEPRVEIEAAADLGETPSLELDVRGMRFEEAIDRLERQIDNALVRGLREFGVIHGKGEGVLQQGIHRYLRGQPAVQEFFFSSPEQGGFGKTMIRLKT